MLVLGIAAGVLILAIWFDVLARFRMWLALLLGLAAGGMLGSWATKAEQWLVRISGAATGKALGYVGLGVIVLAVLAIGVFWIHAHPRTGRGGNRHWHIALAFMIPALLLGVGGLAATVVSTGHGLLSTVSSFASNL